MTAGGWLSQRSCRSGWQSDAKFKSMATLPPVSAVSLRRHGAGGGLRSWKVDVRGDGRKKTHRYTYDHALNVQPSCRCWSRGWPVARPSRQWDEPPDINAVGVHADKEWDSATCSRTVTSVFAVGQLRQNVPVRELLW